MVVVVEGEGGLPRVHYARFASLAPAKEVAGGVPIQQFTITHIDLSGINLIENFKVKYKPIHI
jgi:hypothetical protein